MRSRNTAYVAALLLAAAAIPGAEATGGAVSLCGPRESVVFSCRLEHTRKIVSICASPASGAPRELAYRFGAAGNVELTFVARHNGWRKFHASIVPANERTAVDELWFENENIAYVVATCRTGDCLHRAGLLVYREPRLLMRRACAEDDASKLWFGNDVVRFGSDIESSVALTSLVDLDASGFDVDSLFARRGSR